MKTDAALKFAPPSLSKAVFWNIMQTQNRLAESFSGILKPYDLSPEQFNVLQILKIRSGETVNMHTIQEKMIAKASNTTRLVDRLLLKGFVTREVCLENRRKIEVSITESGLELVEELGPAIDAHAERFAGNLSADELENLTILLEKYKGLTQ